MINQYPIFFVGTLFFVSLFFIWFGWRIISSFWEFFTSKPYDPNNEKGPDGLLYIFGGLLSWMGLNLIAFPVFSLINFLQG